MDGKFILEGPDGAGKTTLAEQLGGESWHHSYYPDKKQMFWETAKSIISPAKTVDRLYYSEFVYSPIYHKVPQRYGHRTRMLDRLVWSESRVIIACLPPYETCYKAWSSGRDEMVSDEAEFKQIYDAYAKLKYNTPAVTYDWTDFDATELAEKVQQAKAGMHPNKGPGIGHYKKGNILIVGDRANNPAIGPDLPFVHWDGCSPWLAEKMDNAGIDEGNLYWVNSATMDGRILCPTFLEDLEPRTIIALGKDAARWCEIADVRHTTVEHPQYWKRFRGSDAYPLINVLRSFTEEV